MFDIAPHAVKPILSLTVKAGEAVQMNLADYYTPHGLYFQLLAGPHWLSLQSHTGLLTGVAPSAYYDMPTLVTVHAYNPYGSARLHFYITVLADAALRSLRSQLSMRREQRERQDAIYKNYPILEYIFAYYQASEYNKMFTDILEKKAKEYGINIQHPPVFNDFLAVVNRENPLSEHELRKRVGRDSVFDTVLLTDQEFQTLFRQGSQPQGIVPIPIWNYLAVPDLQNWSAIDSVLRHAALEVIRVKRGNQQENIMHPYLHPFPHP